MRATRVIVFNMDESFSPALRKMLHSIPDVRIVAEADDPAMLGTVASQFQADVLMLHLDPSPAAVLAIAADLVPAHPNLAIFALSESTDGQLILSAMRRGFREFMTKPVDPEILSTAFEKVVATAGDQESCGKLITILGTAGGVGATSIATNMAVELKSMTSGGVCLVDLDYRFGQVATFLDVSPIYTIADLAQATEELEPQTVERALVEHSSGVRVLSRPTHFTQSENITAASCVNVLTTLQSMHDYVVVDGPNRYDVGASAILDLADWTLIVAQLLVPSVRNAQRILQGMDEAGFDLERAKLIINRISRESGPLNIDDVEATLNKNSFATLPDDWATVCSSINLGEALATRSPKSKIRTAIRDLATLIHSPDGDGSEKEQGKKGNLLSKIFSDA